ncbi:hypothetical protein DY000_02007871 [Brassica cretica]|uniref:Aspartic peptidase DDI1-type domain-containing protein n=1 Tax=Brassica cretica TaxID=69181 RepID=A0ABQ7BXQ5_BRACR|nr:hypothetical protein DY000_02007871 [Brassica cretica]
MSPSSIDRRASLCYQVQLSKIDVAGLNALRNPSQPSKTSTDNIIEKYEDAPEPMQVDHATVGRTLRKNNEKVPKHLKRGTNDKEMDSFTKRILRIPMDKPFEEAYFTTCCGCSSEKPRRLKKTLGECSTIALCNTGSLVSILIKVMGDHLGLKREPLEDSFTFVDCSLRKSGGFIRNFDVQIGNALVSVDFHVLDIKLNWNSSLLLGRAFMATVGAVCDMQSNKLCMTLIDPDTGASIDTQPRVLIDEKSGATIDRAIEALIDRAIEALIDRDPANEIDDFPEGYINSWENDYYQPSFTIHTATPSKRKMSATMEYHGFAMEEEGVLRTSHEAKGETSIERHSSWNRIRRKSRNWCRFLLSRSR